MTCCRPTGSGLAKVLTLCLRDLGVSENPACRSKGTVLLSLVRKRVRSLLHNWDLHRPVYTPGWSSSKVESWPGLRGAVPRPRGLCAPRVRPARRARKGADGGPGATWLGQAGKAPPGPLQASAFPNEKKKRGGGEGAGNTDFSSNLSEVGSSLGLSKVHVFWDA